MSLEMQAGQDNSEFCEQAIVKSLDFILSATGVF